MWPLDPKQQCMACSFFGNKNKPQLKSSSETKSKLELGAREKSQAHVPCGHGKQLMVRKVSFIYLQTNPHPATKKLRCGVRYSFRLN